MKAVLSGRFVATNESLIMNYPNCIYFDNEIVEIDGARFGVVNMCSLVRGEEKIHIYGDRKNCHIGLLEASGEEK